MKVLKHKNKGAPVTALYRELPEGFESFALDRLGI